MVSGRVGPLDPARARRAIAALPARPGPSGLDRDPDAAGHRSARPPRGPTARSGTCGATRPRRPRSASARGTVASCGRTASPRRPESRYADLWVGDIHALVAEPAHRPRPHPTIFVIHGGPEAHDRDTFSPPVQAWVDHGLAVVHGQLPRLHRLRPRLARRADGQPGPDRARGHRRRPRPRRRRRHRRPGAGRPQRRLVGRLPDPARPGHRSRTLGRSASPACRWRTTSPPTRTRWSRSRRSTARCSAARRRRCRSCTASARRSPTSSR